LAQRMRIGPTQVHPQSAEFNFPSVCARSREPEQRLAAESLLLLGRQHGILKCLGQTKLDYRFCWNVDWLTGPGITAHASLSVCLNSLAESRNHELSAALDFFRRQSSEVLQDCGGSLLLNLRLFCQKGYHL